MSNKLGRWLSSQPFKRKLQWVIMAIVLVTVSSALGFLYGQKYWQQRQDFIRTNLALVKLVADYTASPLVFDDIEGADNQLSKLSKDPSLLYLRLEKPDGQIFIQHDPFNISPSAPVFSDKEWLWQNQRLYFSVSVEHEHAYLGRLKGFFSLDSFYQAQFRELRFMSLVLLAAMFSSYLLTLLLRGIVMAPVRLLEAHARYLAEPGIEQNPFIANQVCQTDEIGHLYEAFNFLMGCIQQREQEILLLNHDLENKVRQRTQDLEDSKQILALSLRASHQWLWVWDLQTQELQLDSELVNLCTDTPPRVMTVDWLNGYMHPNDRSYIQQLQINLLMGHQTHCNSEFRLLTKQGDYRWIHTQGQVVDRDELGKPIRMIGTQLDITSRKQAEIDLRIAAIAFESQEGIIVSDVRNNILRVNQAFTKITGYGAEEVIGKNPRLLKSSLHNEDFYRMMWQGIQNDDSWEGQIWNRRKNGEIFPELLTITAVRDDQNKISHYVAIFNDITLSQAAKEEIERLAFTDPLTELPNRRMLMDRLKHAIDLDRGDGKNQLAVLMLDLDRFKAVNDSLGHMAGDDLLQQVASRLRSRLRDSDLVARLGGDEFVILLENISSANDAALVAQEIISDLTQHFSLLQNNTVLIGTSIGISLYPDHGTTAEMLMDHADAALYQAKDAGRGCFAYFSESLTIAAKQRIALEMRLRLALEQQELRVYYQPQVEIDSESIIGAEALVRWQSSDGQLISPQKFIPIAEETGLITEVGHWVLKETCRQGRQWLDEGFSPITLAVNVSPHQFLRSDICAMVAKTIQETGFPAEYLELEITETGLMGNQSKAAEILDQLRTQGIRLAIDDFGTGYSSLAYLKHFPLDVLKIDKSFIEDIPFQQDDMEITATIVAMAHTLGFKVLAEGVETEQQLAFLREKGCDRYQGYIKSKPVPAEEFVRLLTVDK